MCGRFALSTPADRVAEAFEVPDPPQLTSRYNVAPSQVIAVVGLKAGGERRGIALLRWGLVPHWSESPDKGPRPVNVRAESVGYKFGALLRDRRCLIPADGFYEWVAVAGKKQARHFSLNDGGVFAFAGLWDVWGTGKDKLVTCVLVTTAANELVRPVHDRMPVILPRESYAEWLDPGTPEKRLLALMRPYPSDEMRMTAVGPAVNSPKNDGPECLEAA